MPCRIPAARRRAQSPAISVFVSWASPLQAKPIAQAIKDTRIDSSRSMELFPANVLVLIQFNYDDAASADPYFGPVPKHPFERLLQDWILEFEKRPAQFFFE